MLLYCISLYKHNIFGLQRSNAILYQSNLVLGNIQHVYTKLLVK